MLYTLHSVARRIFCVKFIDRHSIMIIGFVIAGHSYAAVSLRTGFGRQLIDEGWTHTLEKPTGQCCGIITVGGVVRVLSDSTQQFLAV